MGQCDENQDFFAAELAISGVKGTSDDALVMVGTAPYETARVSLSYNLPHESETRTTGAELARVTPGLIDEAGAADASPLTYFVAFVPAGVGEAGTESRATATAFDSAGEPTGTIPISWVGMSGTILPCGLGNSISEHACERAVDPEVRVDDLKQELTGELSSAVRLKAQAVGIGLSAASHADYLAASGRITRASPVEEARNTLRDIAHEAGEGATGEFAFYLARAEDVDDPVLVVYSGLYGNAATGVASMLSERAPTEPTGQRIVQEDIVLVNAVTGERLSTSRIP
jgi:hypothetical protein